MFFENSPMLPTYLPFGAMTTGTSMGRAAYTSDAYIQLFRQYQQCE